MTITSHLQTPVILLTLLLAAPAFGWADQPDPTAASPLITARLALDDEAAPEIQPTFNNAAKEPAPYRLRLKAIVLRDADHGTALVSLGNTETYVIALRRTEKIDTANHLNIGGKKLVVKDFSRSFVLLRSPQTNQEFLIN